MTEEERDKRQKDKDLGKALTSLASFGLIVLFAWIFWPWIRAVIALALASH